ncbi:MAG: family N-acetyltransferase [Acidobacteria bacterium]|jgi:GNAT superfamily N-acetyltransferase|nr:family N-acetyltransferase [Acidobacteriota bacterium]
MPTGHLRAATPGDLELLIRLVRDFYLHFGYPFSEPEKRRLLAQVLETPELGRLALLHSEAGEPVGYLFLSFYFSLELGGPVALLDELFVEPAHRGRGLGSRVVGELVEVARGLGLRALQLESERTNARATALYQRLGFVDLDRHLLTLVLEPAP